MGICCWSVRLLHRSRKMVCTISQDLCSYVHRLYPLHYQYLSIWCKEQGVAPSERIVKNWMRPRSSVIRLVSIARPIAPSQIDRQTPGRSFGLVCVRACSNFDFSNWKTTIKTSALWNGDRSSRMRNGGGDITKPLSSSFLLVEKWIFRPLKAKPWLRVMEWVRLGRGATSSISTVWITPVRENQENCNCCEGMMHTSCFCPFEIGVIPYKRRHILLYMRLNYELLWKKKIKFKIIFLLSDEARLKWYHKNSFSPNH